MLKDIVIIGSGGFAKEVAFLIDDINRVKKQWNILGFIDDKIGECKGKFNIIQNDEWVVNTKEKLSVAIGIGDIKLIKILSDKFKINYNLEFPNLIHPNTIGDWDRIKFGFGNIICAGNIFTTDILIGSFNIFNLSCTIGHDSIINNYNIFNPSVNISGGVKIDDCTLIGCGSQILQNITITSDTIIGAGSVVIKSIKESGTYFGIPARRLM